MPSQVRDTLRGCMLSKVLFAAALLFTLTPWSSPPLALAVGLALGLTVGNPFLDRSQKTSKLLLQLCVVALGFGMNLKQVVDAGVRGFAYTAAGIALTVAAGVLLGRLLRVERVESLLISVGTAICGGSAIAAIGPIVRARSEQMSVSLGTVFVLNALALLTFPAIGWQVGLTEEQFGLWAALAIHDTSSVVGATARYGAEALGIGTTVKLARALWIVPLALAIAAVMRRSGKLQLPWFIAGFVGASVIATYLPAGAELYALLVRIAKIGLAVTLFLIGSSVSRTTLREVGPRPLILGVALWLIVALLSLLAVQSSLITV